MFAKPLCAADPFDLLLAPDAVLQAMERSEHLGQLRRRICRPLDARGEQQGEQRAASAGGGRENLPQRASGLPSSYS